jgi:hypothetical protein
LQIEKSYPLINDPSSPLLYSNFLSLILLCVSSSSHFRNHLNGIFSFCGLHLGSCYIFVVVTMTSYSFGAFIDVESSPGHGEPHHAPSAPAKALPRVYHSIPDPIELDSIQWGTKPNGPTNSGAATPSGYQTPRTPLDLEMSRPVTPQNEEQDGVDAMQSFSNPPMNRYRMLCACLMNFGNGLNDSAPGALIPYIETYGPFAANQTDMC